MIEVKPTEMAEGIEVHNGGGAMFTGAGIDFYRLLLIRQALQAQMRGFRLSRKVPQGTTLARRELGLKGNKESLLQQVDELVDQVQQERARLAQEEV